MKKDIFYQLRNLETASNLIACKYEVRDEYLMGQPYYLDLANYITDVLRLTLPSKARVLDVSCGTGILAELLLKELPGITLDASDVSAETLEVVRKRTKRFGNRIHLVEKDNSTYSFTGKYDAICTTNSMRLTFLDYAKLYSNFHNILKKNGVVLIGEAVVPQRKDQILRKMREELNEVRTEPLSGKGYEELASSKEFESRVDREAIGSVVKFYSPAFHIERLKQAGFREAEIIYMKYHHAIIAGMKGKLTFDRSAFVISRRRNEINSRLPLKERKY
ncbi:class I SAM-dependent methyltransferase [candidate division WOR-3 bacterium]|nr:class I SAM-dependent methyltransferase [candidate division WOR-3 bacterium]